MTHSQMTQGKIPFDNCSGRIATRNLNEHENE